MMGTVVAFTGARADSRFALAINILMTPANVGVNQIAYEKDFRPLYSVTF